MGASQHDATITPVVLLVFNRPEPTARVFEAVRAARPPALLVVGDGPRADRPDEAGLVDQVREIVGQVDWPCETTYHYSDENLGCGSRVSSGLDWAFERVPEAIVLEDDCLPHPDFFRFADAMLDRYRHDERVGMIAGTNYFSDARRREAWFFTHYFAIWGWASWARAWRSHDKGMRTWPRLRTEGVLERLFAQPELAAYMAEIFESVARGEVDTWDIQWLHSCLVQEQLCVVPRVNLVANIGYDGTRPPGPNLGMATEPLDIEHPEVPPEMVADRAYEQRLFNERLRAPRTPIRQRLAAAAAGRLRRS